MHCFRSELMIENKRSQRISTSILGIITFFTLVPLLLIVIASFTDEKTLISNGYSFFPKKLSLDAYYFIFKQKHIILRSYFVSIFVTTFGTVVGAVFTTMLAYPMSRKNFKYKNVLAFFVFFTMLFNGGIVPSYIMWTNLFHIKNTIWALILPNYLVLAFHVFLVRNYYANNIPDSLIESAKIDGASEFIIFRKIVFPMAIPAIATVSLFSALIYWNDWVNGLYYITKPQFFGIQNLLIRLMDNIQYLKSGTANLALGVAQVELPGTSARMAMAVIGILPIVIVYPFIQRHFIKGVVVGAIKG